MSATSPKRFSIKWNVPAAADVHSNREDTLSDRYVYSNTFVDDTNLQVTDYSDTFLSDTYSDTFVQSSSNETVVNKSINQINTVLSEVPEATNLETAITEGLETVLEVDYDDTFIAGSSLTITKQDKNRTLDLTESVLPDSYSDTFETSERTKAETSVKITLNEDSQSGTHSASTYTEYSFEDDSSLDQSYIAPDYDGKAQMDDEDDSATLNDEYSFTFEPTELSSYYLDDKEKARLEAEETNIGELAKKEFTKKMIAKLTRKKEKGARQLERIPADRKKDEEDDYLKHYCRKKLKLLRRKKTQQNDDLEQSKEVGTGTPKKLLSDYGVSTSVLERAKLNNIMSAMRRAANESIHEPSKCEQCRELKSVLDFEDAQRQFVTAHAKRLKNKTMDAKVEEHLLKMNSVSLIAELARDLPKASEKPEKILDRLFEPLLGKNVMR